MVKKNKIPINLYCIPFCAGAISIYLGLKPLIDLTWRYSLNGINLQGILNVVIPLGLLTLLILSNPDKVYYLRELKIFYVFVGLVLISLVPNYSSNFLLITFRFIFNVLFLHMMVYCYEVDNFFSIKRLFTFSILVLCVLGTLQIFGVLPYEYYMGTLFAGRLTGRVSATYAHPNDLARILIMYTIFYLCFLKGKSGWFYKFTYYFTIVIMFFTLHRVTLFVMILLILMDNYYSRKYARTLLIISVIFLGVIATYDVLYYSIVEKRLDFSQGFEKSRFRLAEQSYIYYRESPLINKLVGSGELPGGRIYGDCDYLRILYAHGTIALVAYLLFLAKMLTISITQSELLTRKLLLYPTVTLIILSITTDPLRYPSLLVFIFAFWVVGLKRKRMLCFSNDPENNVRLVR